MNGVDTVHETRTIGVRTQIIGLTALLCGTVAGCGPPDLTAMTPDTWKPAAEVWLVDQPPQWQPQDVDHAAGNSGVTVRVESVSRGQLAARTAAALDEPGIGLCVAVAAGAPPDSWLQVARAHPNVSFEWVGTSIAAGAPANVRQLAPDAGAVAYAVGALAGQWLTAMGSGHTVGWVADGSSTLSSASVRQLVAGAYAADPALQCVPVYLHDAQSPGRWPTLVIADRPLTQAELETLQMHGCFVLSPCTQPSFPGIAAQPMLPGEAVLGGDLQAFSQHRWKSGVEWVKSAALLRLGSSVPSNVAAAVTATQTALGDGVAPAGGDPWSTLPPAVRARFMWVVTRGR